MAELSGLRDIRLLGEVSLASADSVTWKSNSIPGSALQGAADVLRSQMKQAIKPITMPLELFRVTGTGALLGAAAGTPAGAMGLTYGTHGSASPILVGESASGVSKTNTARIVRELIPEYADAQALTLRLRARITVAVNTAQTLDVSVRQSDSEGGVGTELYAGAALALTTSWADYDFALTSSALLAGDELDIEVTGVANDTGGTNGGIIQIGSSRILATLQG